MNPRFASQLRIEPEPDPLAVANDVFARVEAWIEGSVDRGPLSLPVAGGLLVPGHGCEVELRLDGDRGGWALAYRRDEGGSRVETKVRLRVTETGLDLGLLEVGEREPIWRSVEPPGFLAELLDAHACRIGAFELSAEPTTLRAPAVEDFTEDLVLASDRSLPLVAVSQDDYLGKPLVDPDALAARLAGLARVFVLEDRSASFALTRSLGNKELGCYLGAVRLYLPGFSLDSDPFDHLLLLPNRLRMAGGRGGSAGDLLLAEAMGRFPEWWGNRFGPLAELLGETPVRPIWRGSHVRQAIPTQEPQDRPARLVRPRAAPGGPGSAPEPPVTMVGLLPRLREIVEENRVLAERNDELEEQIEDANADRDLHAEEIQRLEDRLSALGEQNLELEVKLEEAEADRADLRFVLDKLRREHPELFEAPPGSVLEAVHRIASLEETALAFLPSAYASAEDSPYRYPEKVLSALQALSEVAGQLRRAAETGAGIGAWPVRLFESRGLRYASHNSTTSKGRWSGDYRVTYEGRKIELEEHLSLGSSHDPAECLRIYFFWDPEKRVTVVAHVGRHKRTTLS